MYDLTGINAGYNTEIGNVSLALARAVGPLEPSLDRLNLPWRQKAQSSPNAEGPLVVWGFPVLLF